MTTRLQLIVQGAAGPAAEPVFGDDREPVRPVRHPHAGRADRWWSGPGVAARVTAGWLAPAGAAVPVREELRDLDSGDWRGRTLSEIAADDTAGLHAWLSDPTATPHGGESLVALVERVEGSLHADWPTGRNAVVVPSLVARAAVVAALGAAPTALYRVDVAPLGMVVLSRSGAFWRLRGLGPRRR